MSSRALVNATREESDDESAPEATSEDDSDLDEEAAIGEQILEKIEGLAKVEKCPIEAEIIQARSAGHAIVQEVQTRNIQTIVLGTSKIRGTTGEYFGRTISYILRNTDCEVIIWRDGIDGQTRLRELTK